MQLLITPLAAFDLEEIGDYIAQDNPIRARFRLHWISP